MEKALRVTQIALVLIVAVGFMTYLIGEQYGGEMLLTIAVIMIAVAFLIFGVVRAFLVNIVVSAGKIVEFAARWTAEQLSKIDFYKPANSWTDIRTIRRDSQSREQSAE